MNLATVMGLINSGTKSLKSAIMTKLDAPETAGTANQVLTSDGEGGQVWAAIGQGDITVDNTLSVSGSAADAKKTGDEISEVNSAMTLYKIIEEAEFTKNKYIDVSGSTVDINDPKTSGVGYMYSVVPCVEGDTFIISGLGGGNPRLWTFIQGNGTVISRADNNADETNAIVPVPALAGYCIIQTKREEKSFKVYQRDVNFRCHDDCEPGSVSGSVENGINLATRNFERHRSQGLYQVVGNNVSVAIDFASADLSGIQKVQIIRYTSNFSALKIIEKTSLGDGRILLSPDDSYPYIKVLVYHASDVYSFSGIDIYSDGTVKKVYHPNIPNSNYAALPFSYVMYGKKLASGRLLLPPNYSMSGSKVPLIVYVHGSGGMAEWTSPLYETSSREKCFKYLNNEGFAVFDCYPWAHDITLPNVGATYNPFQIQMHIRAYIEGAKYACSRFNVDINNVCLLCKSQGGNIGHWASVETEFPFRAVGLCAPTTDPVLQDTGEIFYSANCRSMLLSLVDFDGTTTEKNAFITSGNLSNSDVQSFIGKNEGLMVALMPFAKGLTNAESVSTLCSEGFGTLSEVPQWMLDAGLPARQSGYDLIPEFAKHDSYSRNGQRPVRFWCAVDDAQTSTYGNYAIYRYLLNGGTEAEFTFIPTGTGGHNSMDTSDLAQKSSGTTSLGISYTDVPTAYVQIAAYFHKYV